MLGKLLKIVFGSKGTGAQEAVAQIAEAVPANDVAIVLANPDDFAWTPDILQQIVPLCSFKTVCSLSQVSRNLRALLSEEWVWWLLCLRDVEAADCVDDKLFTEWKELYRSFAAIAPVPTILSSVLDASSTENPDEAAANTLVPSGCSRGENCRCSPNFLRRPCYWSSGPSPSADSDDWIEYGTHACLVTAIEICPYDAYWQPVSVSIDHDTGIVHRRTPVYAPTERAEAQIRVGRGIRWEYQVQVLSKGVGCEPDKEIARFPFLAEARGLPMRHTLPKPRLVLSGQIRANFLGKVQKQPIVDHEDYYVCINYFQRGDFSSHAESKVDPAHNAYAAGRHAIAAADSPLRNRDR
eukprot:gene10242-12117_t